MAKIIECIPNFSEGRDLEKVEKIVNVLRGREGVKLLDYSSDSDHNRTVVTVIGEPSKLEEAIIEFAGVVYENIDMKKHEGGHPRMGALDVVPFVPISDVTMKECIEMASRVGEKIGEMYSVPVYLYEEAATATHRTNLANVRKGQYEGFFEKIKEAKWRPDFGPTEMNENSGCTAISAIEGAVLNVKINLTAISDEQFKNENIKKCNHIVNEGKLKCEKIQLIVNEKIGIN